ncbi:MAG: hypothetical protein ABL879_05160 [Devosia sp.]
MANETERETPSQGIFVGYLAVGLLAFALLIAAWGIITGLTHPPVV